MASQEKGLMMPGSPPPDPDKIKSLDFSEFHALDHFPGSAYCRTQYGSWRVHLKYGWDYRWRDDVQRPFRKLLCKVGKHDVRPYWSRPDEEWEEHACCEWCGGARS